MAPWDRDDTWGRYPASVPRKVEGGIATSKKRGQMAATWWSRRFVALLESYGLGSRMQRGRRYARTGQVIDISVGAASIAAKVQGSRATPYRVTVKVVAPSDTQWKAIVEAMRARVGFVASLLDGEVPVELEEVFASCGVPLFPAKWKDLQTSCSCPDWENPCKHIAAVLYVFADQLDEDPWLALELRGRQRETLLDALVSGNGDRRGGRLGGGGEVGESDRKGGAAGVAPWWPFASGPLPVMSQPQMGLSPVVDSGLPSSGSTDLALAGGGVDGRPDAVLDGLEVLDLKVGQSLFVDLLRPLYERIVVIEL